MGCADRFSIGTDAVQLTSQQINWLTGSLAGRPAGQSRLALDSERIGANWSSLRAREWRAICL